MRHVVLGMDTILGTSILRVLISLTDHQIIACGEDATLPEGIPKGRVSTIAINPENPIELGEILNPDDVVYFCDILKDEETLDKSLIKRNRIYFSNLLFYANERNIKKIIAYLPQATGWKIPPNADETSVQTKSSIYHKSLLEIEDLSNLYWNGEIYYEEKVSADDELVIDFSDADLLSSFEQEFGDTDFEIDPFGTPEITNNENDALTQKDPPFEDTPASSSHTGPPLGDTPASSTHTGPPLGDTPASSPNTGPPDEDTDLLQTDINLSTEIVSDDSEIDLDKSSPPSQKNDVPLVLARIARFFGPFEPNLTEWFCHSVRLRRIVLIGKSEASISWINPIDAARAMIILADQKPTNEQFFINGFNASAKEILTSLDKVNGSNITIKTKFYFLRIIKLKLMQILSKVGIGTSLPYFKYYGLNTKQLFNDAKARKIWNWKPRYDLSGTANESMKWFINHVLSKKKSSN